MKRILLLILSMAMLVCAVPHMAFAANTTIKVKGLTYELKSNRYVKIAVLTNANGASGEVEIPTRIINWEDGVYEDYNVISIGDRAFFDCDSLKSITIGRSVINIGNYAFSNCLSLESVTIGSGVTTIGKGAFSGCSRLESVEIPNSVTTIGMDVFHSCDSLKFIEIGSGVTTIGKDAFSGCNSLSGITIPHNFDKTVLNTGITGCNNNSNTFTNSDGKLGHFWIYLNKDNITYHLDLATKEAVLTDGKNATGTGEVLEIPAKVKYNKTNYSVTTIGKRAFYKCRVLSSDERAFTKSCTLTSVRIPNSVTTIGDRAFGFCNKLTSVNIPNSVTSIGKGAFDFCNSLTSVNIPDGVTSIGYETFNYCSSLKSVTIGSGVTTIDDRAFSGCKSLASINVDAGNKDFKVESDVLFNMAGTKLVLCSRDKRGSYTIPDCVTSIGYRAFEYCRGLTSVTIPDSVTTIGDCAFEYCSRLASITIGNKVESIGVFAFQSCSKLGSVKIPDSVTSIGDSALDFCESLESVTIPSDFDKGKFKNTGINVNYCFDDNTFSNFGGWKGYFKYILNNGSLTYELDSETKQAVLIDGKNATGAVRIPATVSYDGNEYNVTAIGGYAFYKCVGLTSLAIPSSVESIGKGAFFWCSKLTSIKIPSDFVRGEFKGTNITVGDNDTFTNSGGGLGKFKVDLNNGTEETVDDFMSSNNIINPSLKQNQNGLTCWMFASMNIENYYRVRNHMQPIDGSEVDQACNFVARKLNRPDILNNTQTAQEMIFYLNEKKISVKDYSFTVSDSSEKSDVIGAIESLLEDHFSNPDVQYHPPVAVNQNANHWITIIGINGDDYLVCNSLKDNDEPYFVKKKEILDSILGEVNAERHGATTDILVPNGIHSVYRGEVKNNHLSYLPKYGQYYDEKLGTIRFNARAFSSMFMKSYDIKVFSDNNGKFILDSNKSKRYLNDLGNYIEVVGGARTFKGNLEFTPFYTEKEKCGATILLPVAGSAKCKTEYGERSINYFRDKGKYVIFDSELNPKEFDTLAGLQQYVVSSEFSKRDWREINNNVAKNPSPTPKLPILPQLPLPSAHQTILTRSLCTPMSGNMNNNHNNNHPDFRGGVGAFRARGSHGTQGYKYKTYSNDPPHLTPYNFGQAYKK